MPIWTDEYPHKIYASALLLDGMIYQWKVGPTPWNDPAEITFRGNIQDIKDIHTRLTVVNGTWSVSDNEEHHMVFKKHAPKWFKNWRIHPQKRGVNPY